MSSKLGARCGEGATIAGTGIGGCGISGTSPIVGAFDLRLPRLWLREAFVSLLRLREAFIADFGGCVERSRGAKGFLLPDLLFALVSAGVSVVAAVGAGATSVCPGDGSTGDFSSFRV
jgi:hypothetical protein